MQWTLTKFGFVLLDSATLVTMAMNKLAYWKRDSIEFVANVDLLDALDFQLRLIHPKMWSLANAKTFSVVIHVAFLVFATSTTKWTRIHSNGFFFLLSFVCEFFEHAQNVCIMHLPAFCMSFSVFCTTWYHSNERKAREKRCIQFVCSLALVSYRVVNIILTKKASFFLK